MKRIIIIVILLVVAIGGFIGYRMYDQRTPDVTDKKPDFVITAKELLAAFDKDTASARMMYVDKLIEVTGRVASIDTTGSVVLGEEGTLSAVSISLDRRHIKDHEKLNIGQIAVLQGICSGYSKGDDMLADLGMTVELNFGGVKGKK